MALTLKLKDGSIRTVAKGPRDKAASKAAKARRLEASQKGKTNIGNPIPKGGAKRK